MELNPKLLSICIVLIIAHFVAGQATPVVRTTSGTLRGVSQAGVNSFKGIPFGQPPVNALRWEPPQPFVSTKTIDATTLGPACLQQFLFATQALNEKLFNSAHPPESEDCLFLNVFAPADTSGPKKSVMVWLFGGGLAFGTASLPAYDGTSFAKNQDIVVVTINYRTNAFGFPGGEELFPAKENLGFMDQDLALQWVQQNIAGFGGDPAKVTIMGESAGALSVSQAIQRHARNPPFRAGIMESGTAVSTSPVPDFTAFDAMAKAVNCTHAPGATRLACLKAVPAAAIHDWANGPQGIAFGPVVDNITAFSDPIQRIQEKRTARVPILLGANQDDGTLFSIGITSLSDFLQTEVGGAVSPDQVRAVYPGLNDTQIIPTALRDLTFLCPDELTSAAFVRSGVTNVFRYLYGAVFADLQLFPNAGAWHSTEIAEIFGTFNTTTASADEVTLSKTMQTVWANFIKNPTASPAPNWERFVPGNNTGSLARLAFEGNVRLLDVVRASPAGLVDGPCDKLWNALVGF